MGLAGCSLPFFSQKKVVKELPSVEVEEAYESAEKVVEEIQAVENQEIKKDETIWNTEKIEEEETPILKDLEASVFEEEEEIVLEEEVMEEVIIGGLVEGEEMEPELYVEEMLPDMEEGLVSVVEDSSPSEGFLEDDIEQVLEEEAEVLDIISPEVVMLVVEIEKEEELLIEDIEIPAGALPSTGAISPLASLWGWVKSWF